MFTNVNRPSAVDVLRPFVIGDMFYADSTTTLAKLTIGSETQVLNVATGIPTWTSTISLTGLTVKDNTFNIVGNVDDTKRLRFEVDAQTAGARLNINTGAQTVDRTLTVPVLTADATLMVLSETQTVTGAKTFSNAAGVVVSAATGTTLTVSSTDAAALSCAGGVSAASLKVNGFTLTVPATGTVGLLGTANTWTQTNGFQAVTCTTLVASGSVTAGDATMGEWGVSAAFAFWQHKDLAIAAGNYALIQQDDGLVTALNVGTGGTGYLRVNNSTVMSWTSTGAAVTGSLTASGLAGVGGGTNSAAVITIGSSNPLAGTAQVALLTDLTATSAATGAVRGFQTAIGTAAASFTCAEATSIMTGVILKGAGSTITRAYALRTENPTEGGSCNIAIANASALSETGNWFIYDSGTYDSQFGGQVLLPATSTARASVRLPHGSAPSSPVDGDMWTTTAGLYVRINGATVGPLS